MKPKVILRTSIINKTGNKKYITHLHHIDKTGKKHHKHMKGEGKGHTANALHLKAILQGLYELKLPSRLSIYTNSAYIFSSVNERWLDSWIENGWINAKGKKIANKELWQQLSDELANHEYQIIMEYKGESIC